MKQKELREQIEDSNNITIHLNNKQIEQIACIFSQGNCTVLELHDCEWLLSHAFQLGAKYYREYVKNGNV